MFRRFFMLQTFYLNNMHELTWQEFQKVDLRIGTIIKAEQFKEALKPAYKLLIDFGELGIIKSSAQITSLYSAEELIGKQIVAVVNFPKKQIGPMMSECLVLGSVNKDEVTLLQPERAVRNGSKIS